MKHLWIVLALLTLIVWPSIAHAQTKWTLRVYTVGGSTPVIAPVDLPSANVGCGQNMPPAGSTINVEQVVFDDPTIAGKVCIWADPTSSHVLATIPESNDPYEATLTASSATMASLESARSAPFTMNSAPPVPTGVRLRR